MKQMQPGNARGVSTLGNFRWGIGAFERLYAFLSTMGCDDDYHIVICSILLY